MSIVRDLLEYYKLPPVIKGHQDDFRSSNEVMNGYDLRYYYDKDKDWDGTPLPGRSYSQRIYHYTPAGVGSELFSATTISYNEKFEILKIEIYYDGGKKRRTETSSYGSPAAEYPISNFVQTIDTNIAWPPTIYPSTGWPDGAFGGVGGMKWVYIDATISPGKHNYGYMCNTSSAAVGVYLPKDVEIGYTVAIGDAYGTFHNNHAVFIVTTGINIMGLHEHLYLNERYQGCQLVHRRYNDWRIVWSTPLIANVSTP